MSPLNADQKALAFQVLELVGEEIIKEWLTSRNQPVKAEEATGKISEMTDALEKDDAAEEEALRRKFPEAQPGTGQVKP